MKYFAKMAAVAALLMAPVGAAASTVSATLDFDTPDSVFQFVTDHPSGNISTPNGNCQSGSCLSVRAGGGGETVTLSRVDGGSFTLEGFWFQLLGQGQAQDNTLQVSGSEGTTASFSAVTYGHNTPWTVSFFPSLQVTSFTFQNLNRGGLRVDDIRVTYDMAPVPLPATGLLLIAGVGGLAVMRRRRRAA